MEEKAVSLKKKTNKTKKTNNRECIIHYSSVNNKLEVRQLTETTWQKIKLISEERFFTSCSTSFNEICDQIPSEPNFTLHGFHRDCYKRFTHLKNLNSRKRKLELEQNNDIQDVLPKKKRQPSGDIVLFPQNECIICGKGVKWIKHKGTSKRDKLVKCVTKTAENSLKQAAVFWKDDVILRKISEEDLVAKEANYHEECRKAFINTKYLSQTCREDSSYEDAEIQKAHKEAFNILAEYIEKDIIQNANVLRITMLKQRYQLYIKENYPTVYNQNYSNQKLKEKIVKHFRDRVHFFQPKYRAEIVYSNEISTGQAVEFAFESSASDYKLLENAALLLRSKILEKHIQNCETQWPPTSEYLQSSPIPDHLIKFLLKLVVPSKTKNVSLMYERKVQSIAQDICYSVTKGTWLLPKQLLLGMSVHHLTGSAKLVTLLNRLGHCVSYSSVLQLETSIAEKIIISDSVLPAEMLTVNNIVTHFCWDNFDLSEETPDGYGTTHSTHGIAIQEHSGNKDEQVEELVYLQKSKRRSIQFMKEDLSPCTMSKRSEPNIQPFSHVQSESSSNRLDSKDVLWLLNREMTASEDRKAIPGWSGWLSLSTNKNPPEFPSKVSYMRPIHHPATENATIQEVLKRSKEASEILGQDQTIVTFDLATAKKAYSIIWNAPNTYKDVFIRLGTFHVICAYFKAMGKVLEGSGFEEVVLESGMCASGSINGVMTGKHYNRALKIHKVYLEAMERLLMKRFLLKQCASEKWNKLKSILKELEINSSSIQDCCENNEFKMLYHDYEIERAAIKDGSEGLTAQFWVQHLDRMWLVLQLIRSLKENDFTLYKSSLKSMAPLFFIMDHQNYARYLTAYVASLDQIDCSHPQASHHLRECALSVTRSKYKASGTAVDQTIEQTINKHAKSAGGVVGLSRNLQAYDRWILTRHERAHYVSTMLGFVGMGDNGSDQRRDQKESDFKRGSKSVEKTIEAICNFINPFEMYEQDCLVCLSSGLKVPQEVAQGLVKLDEIGSNEHEKFIKERLYEKEISLHAPLKKKKLKTFAVLKKTITVKNKMNKEIKITAQRNIYAQLVMIAQANEIDIEKLFAYPLGPVPWPLATGDGMLAKTDKAVLLHKLENNIHQSQNTEVSKDDVYILDGNVLLHSLVSIPETYGQLARKIFNCLPPVSVLHFVTDTYKEMSIKSTERLRRGTSDPILIKGPSSKIPRNFQMFLTNDENKKRLIALICHEWSSDAYAGLLKNRELYFVNEQECTLMTSEDGLTTDVRPVPELYSSQEEADTRIILHLKYVNDHGRTKKVVIRSTDTDVFLLLLHFSS